MARGGPGVTKRTWLSEEDERLLELVRMLGVGNWTTIAIELSGGRTSKQCRERWHNHLDPSVKKGPWTPEEDRLLLSARDELGNAWSLISERIEGRTDMAVKNRWQTFVRSAQRKGSDVIQSTAVEEGEAASSMQKKRCHGGRRMRRPDPATASSSSSSSSEDEDEDKDESDAATLRRPPPIATAHEPSGTALKWTPSPAFDAVGNDDVSRGFSPLLHFSPSPATGAGDDGSAAATGAAPSTIAPTTLAAPCGAESPFAAYLVSLGQSQSGASPAIAASFSPSMLSPHSPTLSPALHSFDMMMPPPPPRAPAPPTNAKSVAPTLMAPPPASRKTMPLAPANNTTILQPPPPPVVVLSELPPSPPAEAVLRFAEVLGQQAAEAAAAAPSPSLLTPYVPMRIDTSAAPTTAALALPSRKRLRDETITALTPTRFGGGVPALPSPLRGAPPMHAAARDEDQPKLRPEDAQRPTLLLHAAEQIRVNGQPQQLQQFLPSAPLSAEPRSSKMAKLTVAMPVVTSNDAPANMRRMFPPPAPIPACVMHTPTVACM